MTDPLTGLSSSESSFSEITVSGNGSIGGDLTVTGDVSADIINCTTVNTTTPAGQFSDERLKDNPRILRNVWYPMNQIHGRTYHRNDVNQDSMGFFAQEVEQYFPFLVSTQANGFKMMKYTPLIACNWEANKSNRANILHLHKRIEFLEQKLTTMDQVGNATKESGTLKKHQNRRRCLRRFADLRCGQVERAKRDRRVYPNKFAYVAN